MNVYTVLVPLAMESKERMDLSMISTSSGFSFGLTST